MLLVISWLLLPTSKCSLNGDEVSFGVVGVAQLPSKQQAGNGTITNARRIWGKSKHCFTLMFGVVNLKHAMGSETFGGLARALQWGEAKASGVGSHASISAVALSDVSRRNAPLSCDTPSSGTACKAARSHRMRTGGGTLVVV